MTIDELLALTGLTGSDEIPVWDKEASGEPTKKITAQNFAAAVKTLASLLGTGDVVNDLTNPSTSTVPSTMATMSLIPSGDIASGNSQTLTPPSGGSHLLILSRQNNNFFLIIAYDYWTNGYTVVAGQEKSGVTISKSALNSQITINNTAGFAIGYKLI